MNKTIAYIRVSDVTKQDSSSQQSAITSYAKEKNLIISEYREFNLSGSKTCREERGINQLIEDLNDGDNVIISDIARLGRDDTHALLNTITSITCKGASIHFAYSNTFIAPEDTNDISKIFIALGEAFAAVKFAEERSRKASEACKVRKTKGLANGRQKGAIVKSKLDDFACEIMSMIDSNTKKTEMISYLNERGLNVSRMQLYRWIDKKLGSKSIKKKGA